MLYHHLRLFQLEVYAFNLLAKVVLKSGAEQSKISQSYTLGEIR